MKILKLKTDDLTVIPHIGKIREAKIKEQQLSNRPIKDDLELSKIKGIGNIRGREILKWIEENNIKIIY